VWREVSAMGLGVSSGMASLWCGGCGLVCGGVAWGVGLGVSLAMAWVWCGLGVGWVSGTGVVEGEAASGGRARNRGQSI